MRNHEATFGEGPEEGLAVGDGDRRQDGYARRHAATLPDGPGHKRLGVSEPGTIPSIR
jgi:hypothetical protein